MDGDRGRGRGCLVRVQPLVSPARPPPHTTQHNTHDNVSFLVGDVEPINEPHASCVCVCVYVYAWGWGWGSVSEWVSE